MAGSTLDAWARAGAVAMVALARRNIRRGLLACM
jgi:hypothetical protein